jgi:thymidylate kinase
MLKIYSELFEGLDREKVFYCSWKSNHLLTGFLNGKGDVDLYVNYIQKSGFEKTLLICGFVKADSFVASHKYVEHYFALDIESGKTVHLHVYFKIVTGESNSKNYILPIENWIKDNTVLKEIRVLSDDAQLVVFLLRYFIKIGSTSSLLLYARDFKKYQDEWASLINASLPSELPILRHGFIQSLYNGYLSSNIILKIILSLKLKLFIMGFARRGIIKHTGYKVLNTIKRVINKIFFKKKKLLDTGVLVAFCGLDGSGKSSAVEAVCKNFSENFTVKEIHIGRPNPTLLTFPFWFAFRGLEKIKHGKIKNEKPVEKFIPKEYVSTTAAIRYTILAYERYKLSKKASKYVLDGYIVISDRYPSFNYGKMDSPRVVRDGERSILYRTCHQIESWCYKSISPCDLACHLSVPLEIAIVRNQERNKSGKETDNEIRARYLVNSDLTFNTNEYQLFDATLPMNNLHEKLIRRIWSILG